jgi:hypothetical protein
MNQQSMKIIIRTPKFLTLPLTRKIASTLFIILTLFSIGFGGYAYWQWQQTQELLKDPAKREQEEFKSTVAKIGTLIKLPVDETPTLATVSEADRLKNMTFFKDAQNGDKVLMYIKNRKAYLYRPADEILVEVATINVSDQANTNQQQANVLGTQQNPPARGTSSNPVATLTIRNGTQTPNLAATAREKLSATKGFEVAATQDAARTDYPQSVVVVLNEEFEQQGKELAKMYNTDPIIVPPQGETVPNTDLLLILGSQ